MFAPAEHTDSLKRRREKKRREKQEKKMLQQQQKMMRNNKNPTFLNQQQQTPQQKQTMTPTSQTSTLKNHQHHNHAPVYKTAGPTLNLNAIDEVSSGSNYHAKAPVTPPSPGVRHPHNQETPRDKSSFMSSVSPKSPHLLQESRQGTPPSDRQLRPAIPKSPSRQNPATRNDGDFTKEDEEVWYAKWWMMCFPDVIKTMTQNKN